MPLELGMFLGAKEFGDSAQRAKKCLVLDRSPHRYEKFCSDIKGCDISSHRRNPEAAIRAVRDFLRANDLIFNDYTTLVGRWLKQEADPR